MGLVVHVPRAAVPWSPSDTVRADLARRVAVAPRSASIALADDCHVATLDRLHDGSGTWRLELGPGASVTVEHPDLTLDAFLAEGRLDGDGGDWTALGYRRFPPGTAVSLSVLEPATLWLKARPLPLWRRRAIRIDAPDFGISPMSGLELCELSPAGDARVVLLRFPPGSSIGWHEHERGEELVVVRGCLHDDQGIYPTGSWVRQPPGSGHEVSSPEGCLLYTHSGHLAR